MKATIQFAKREGYLLATVFCPWTTENAKRLIDASKLEAISQGYNHILFDLTEWTQPDTELTRFWSGEHLAKQLPPPFKSAAFAIPQAINKFGETAAVNRGALFRIFPDKRDAIHWLLECVG